MCRIRIFIHPAPRDPTSPSIRDMKNYNQQKDNAQSTQFFGNSPKGNPNMVSEQMEQQIRKIVKDEIEKNSRSGAPIIAPHTHNGKDNLRVTLPNIVGADTLPSGNAKFATPFLPNDYGFASQEVLGPYQIIMNNYVNQTGVPLTNTSTNLSATVPIPVIFSDDDFTFHGGNAQIGTMVMFQKSNLSSNQLWVMGYDGWWGVNLPLFA